MTKFTREELQPIFDTLFPNSSNNVIESDWKKLEEVGLVEPISTTKIVEEAEEYLKGLIKDCDMSYENIMFNKCLEAI
jgi:hypothetical protein